MKKLQTVILEVIETGEQEKIRIDPKFIKWFKELKKRLKLSDDKLMTRLIKNYEKGKNNF